MSTAALVGSYFIFYGIPFNENNRHGDEHHTIKGTNMESDSNQESEHEEPDSQLSHSESSDNSDNANSLKFNISRWHRY